MEIYEIHLMNGKDLLLFGEVRRVRTRWVIHHIIIFYMDLREAEVVEFIRSDDKGFQRLNKSTTETFLRSAMINIHDVKLDSFALSSSSFPAS